MESVDGDESVCDVWLSYRARRVDWASAWEMESLRRCDGDLRAAIVVSLINIRGDTH